jgi:DNA-directed RNA polymerase subunit RPC12/RpoP
MSDAPIRCPVCQSFVDEEELFCANCGTEAPHREEKTQAAADTSRLATCNFQCSGCGASMSYDASAAALRCPFCGSVEMEKRADAQILSPRRVVPFSVAHEQAVAAMRQWLGRGFFRPGDLAREAAVVKITAVYVPYWVFAATTHTFWTADTSQTPGGARADWYPLSGEHRGSYAGLLVGASGALTPGETSAIGPFNLASGVPPEQADLDNVIVEQFGVPRKYARPLAQAGLEQLEAEACQRGYVPGRARNVHVNVRVEGLSSEPILLPVWIMAYRYRDQVYRFLVNGQTGRATGQAPVSWPKILLIVAIIACVLLFVVLLCSGVVGGARLLSQSVPPLVGFAAARVPDVRFRPGATGVSPVFFHYPPARPRSIVSRDVGWDQDVGPPARSREDGGPALRLAHRTYPILVLTLREQHARADNRPLAPGAGSRTIICS